MPEIMFEHVAPRVRRAHVVERPDERAAREAMHALAESAQEARARAGQGTTQQRLADIEARLAEIELRLGLGRVRPSATKGRAVEVKEEGT